MARPKQIARSTTTGERVSNIGNATKPHAAASSAPARYTGLRPTRSVSRPDERDDDHVHDVRDHEPSEELRNAFTSGVT